MSNRKKIKDSRLTKIMRELKIKKVQIDLNRSNRRIRNIISHRVYKKKT